MAFTGFYFNIVANWNFYEEILSDYNFNCTFVCAFALNFGITAALNFNFAHFCRRLKLNGNFNVGMNFGFSFAAVLTAAGSFRALGSEIEQVVFVFHGFYPSEFNLSRVFGIHYILCENRKGDFKFRFYLKTER